MTTRDRITRSAIRGLFNAALLFLPAYCAAWLLLGHWPVWWQIFIASEVLEIAVRAFLRHRRRREIRTLQAQFDKPAYGDH